MAEMPMNERELEAINQKMAEHSSFKPGMRGVACADGRGYEIEGGDDAPAIFSWAKAQLEREK